MPKHAHDLARFVEAQDRVYPTVLAELRAGRKRTHWMWFVFPQIAGLGLSPTARFYAIESGAEARAYLDHSLLGARLRDCARALLAHEGKSAEAIFGPVDAMKLKSSMTLFERAGGPGEPFGRCLDAFFAGARDQATLRLLGG